MLGFSEFLEYLKAFDDGTDLVGKSRDVFLKAATATCDFYIDHSAVDGIPYWDTGAPNLHRLGKYQDKPADPFNSFEPVDSSAAAIAAQGFLRLGRYLEKMDRTLSTRYTQAGLRILETLLSEPYLSTEATHEGLLLHSVYHHPNGWDNIPNGRSVPCGESSMWGDYHMAELCYTAHEMINERQYTFYTDIK
jgi:hypothetical protein